MTLTQLRHFVVLASLGSFAKTAQTVFVTQPALTRSIKALEDELGASLFDRVGRRTELTPFGRQAVERAQRLIADAKSLKSLQKELSEGIDGHLRIGLGSGPGVLLSGRLLNLMAAKYPKLRFSISRGNTPRQLESLREQQIDAALLDIRAMRPSSEFHVSHIFEMPAAFMVRDKHPLLTKKTVSIKDIREYPICSTPLSDEVARLLTTRYGSQANPDDMVTLRSDETDHIVEVGRHTDAVVLTIRAAAPDLVPLPMRPALNATAKFGLVTLNRRQAAPGMVILHQWLPTWIEELQRNR